MTEILDLCVAQVYFEMSLLMQLVSSTICRLENRHNHQAVIPIISEHLEMIFSVWELLVQVTSNFENLGHVPLLLLLLLLLILLVLPLIHLSSSRVLRKTCNSEIVLLDNSYAKCILINRWSEKLIDKTGQELD